MRPALRQAAFAAALLAVASCGPSPGGYERHGTSAQREWWKAIRQASAPGRDATLKNWGWVRVRSVEGLAAVVTLPGKSKKPVVVYFFAKWSLPNEDLERDVFDDPAVKARLRGFTLVYVDVTAPDAEERELQQVLKGGTVPSVHVFEDGGELAVSLRGDDAPVPRASVDKVVGVDDFLSVLTIAGG